MQKIRILVLCCFVMVLIMAGCGGALESGEPETAVSATATAEPETAVVAPEDSAVAEEAPDTISLVIPAAPTSTFNPEGLGPGGSRFVSLNDPDVILAAEASWLTDDDIVIGVVQNGEARAYPIRQMAFHHIANDTLGGEPYLVTY